MKWKEIFANPIADKGLISKIYKKHEQLSSKIPNNLIKKWMKNLNRHISKEDVQMANRYIKRCSVLLIIRKMQIKTTVRYRLTPIGKTIIKKIEDNRCCKAVEERELLCTTAGNVNWCSHYDKNYGGSSTFKNRTA